MKSGRRRSPVPSRKHGEKGEKGGGSGSSGGGGGTGSAVALLNTPHGTSSNAHLSPAASNLALPATPSTQSLLSIADGNHSNLQSTTSAPTGGLDSSLILLPAVSMLSKTAVEDQSLEDDPVNKQICVSVFLGVRCNVI